MLTILIVIAILVLLIVVHEFGHFVAAKIFRVKVEEFGVGYPPRAFTFGRWGGTEYTLNWVPFGGFVRLFGDEGEGKHGRGSFVDAPRWKQAIILVAGVGMNAVGAWVLFTIALHSGVPQAVATPPPNVPTQLIVADIVPNSPAAASGIVPGDQVLGITDTSGATPTALTPDAMVTFVSAHGGQKLTMTYEHAGATESATMIPANAVIPGEAGEPALGIALALVASQSEPWGESAVDAFYETGNTFAIVWSNLETLGQSIVHGAPDLSQVTGPVGIVGYVGQAAQEGFGSVLFLAALISVNLAIINLLPIPALDGGRLFILIIETVTRRPAPRLAVQMLNALGVALIVIIMVVVTYHDIARLIA